MRVNIRGYNVQIDDEDFEIVESYPWCRSNSTKIYFTVWMDGRSVFLHRILVSAPINMQVDHIDGDTTNNRKINLRLATPRQNGFNRSKPKNNTSGFKGVSWNGYHKKWRADIDVGTGQKFLGYFHDPVEASKAYKAAAIKYAGEFARW